jgi:phospholipid/cholesterol/gamma-HCH transport system substrate-binding protein
MIKETPSIGRILAMVVFALSCIGILMFLWLSFGGPIPLQPQGYRFQVRIPEAATLAQEADVRLAGVNVGKVKTKELDKGGVTTKLEVELKEAYSPIPRDTHVILRQKTLLGESYLELSPGRRATGMLKDGDELRAVQVEPTVELDEIFTAFDKPTRTAFQDWMQELARATKGGRGEDLNSAFGNLEGFAVDGAKLLEVLDEQEVAVRRLVRNTGEVFGAINERQGALGELIVNSNNTFEATASRDEALAETFEIFPTFLDESKATLARLERFAGETRPLIRDFKRPASDLGPTVRDLGDLAPDLERLFRDLPPLIRAGRTGLPDLTRVLEGAEPLLAAIRPFLAELNPILSYANFHQDTIAGFLTIGGANFGCPGRNDQGGCDIQGTGAANRYQVNFSIIEPRSFDRRRTRPQWERGNAYLNPNGYLRAAAVGVLESFDCKPTGGQRTEPTDTQAVPTADPTQPPCFVAPTSLYNGKKFVNPAQGDARKVDAPNGREGTSPANDPHPTDPLR